MLNTLLIVSTITYGLYIINKNFDIEIKYVGRKNK
mgnify:CR=1 FL=1